MTNLENDHLVTRLRFLLWRCEVEGSSDDLVIVDADPELSRKILHTLPAPEVRRAILSILRSHVKDRTPPADDIGTIERALNIPVSVTADKVYGHSMIRSIFDPDRNSAEELMRCLL